MKINLLILFIAVSIQLHAQVRQGVVLNADTRRPIPNASVHINNTTIGTSSNAEGVFSLQGFPAPPYQIHVSAIGYETRIVEIPRQTSASSIAILLIPKISELAEAAIETRRIVHPGCNSNEPGFGWDLGVINRGGERTISRGRMTQIWSDPVTASNCRKRTFDGGSPADYSADCRSNPAGFRGDFFSWCAVMRFAEVLCPAPWRVPTARDFANLSRALCDNHEGTYHILPWLREKCHGEFLQTWGGFHHGFSDPTGNVHRQGRLVYYWEYLHIREIGLTESAESRDFSTQRDLSTWRIYTPDAGNLLERDAAYYTRRAVYNWEKLPDHDPLIRWRVIARHNVHDKGEIAYYLDVEDKHSFSITDKHRESQAVYYWSQSSVGAWKTSVLALSADRDPTYRPQRQRNRDKDRWGYYTVLPNLIIDKNFGFTLRCVRDDR